LWGLRGDGPAWAQGEPDAETRAAVAGAMASLDAYMAAFNARDAAAWAATLHYPHVRIAGDDVRVWASAEEFAAGMDFAAFAERVTWSHGAWGAREAVQAGPDKVHATVTFSRYAPDGAKIASYDSLYVMTRKDGRWGTQARSSFAP